MSCCFSSAVIPQQEEGKSSKESTPSMVEWKILPSEKEARKKFEADGTLAKNSDAGHLELRTMLDDPISQNRLGNYARSIKVLDVFMCWVDIQEFKSIPTENYKRSKALHIYHKYIKEDAVLKLDFLDSYERDEIIVNIEHSKEDSTILGDGIYDDVQKRCFLKMYEDIFLPFKKTTEYIDLNKSIKTRYNYVKLSDFEYYGKLGEGGFGFVVHCKKKSTGKHYAMKIQTKNGLLNSFSHDPSRANVEREAFAACQHPFIVNMDYSFQTPSLAIMVLGLAEAGDLNKCLLEEPTMRLSEERVQFYVAEIVLALSYLHQMGLIYRDLKPQNVLLNEDGHIQLVDLGGVMDEDGNTFNQNKELEGFLPLITKDYPKQIENNHNTVPTAASSQDNAEVPAQGKVESEDEKESEEAESNPKKEKKRKLSIMGTLGYMAPEMVLMLNHHRKPLFGDKSFLNPRSEDKLLKHQQRSGYSSAVDWWSLGATLFKLLTGSRPFMDDNFHSFVEMASTINRKVGENLHFREYAKLFQKIPFPDYLSAEAKDLVSKLLDVNEKTRLGSGPNGVKDIKNHPFFRNINWDILEQKLVEPPFKPEIKAEDENLIPYPDLKSLFYEYGKTYWLEDEPEPEYQKYFANWDFTSPHTIRVEAGLSYAMQQYDKNFKIRQVMGSKPVEESRKPEKTVVDFSSKIFSLFNNSKNKSQK